MLANRHGLPTEFGQGIVFPWAGHDAPRAEQSAAADGGPFIGFPSIMPSRPPLLSFVVMKFMMLRLAFIPCLLLSTGCGKTPPDAPKSEGQGADCNSGSGGAAIRKEASNSRPKQKPR